MPKILVKMADVSIFGHFLTLYRILGITKHVYIVEQVLSFDLVGHL